MQSRLYRFIAAMFLLPSATMSSAHDRLANFKLNIGLTVEGSIAGIAPINPHSWNRHAAGPAAITITTQIKREKP